MKVVFFTGSGISDESGIPTFRERNALWEDYDPKIYASIASWRTHKEEMLHFHNEFRRLVLEKEPNAAVVVSEEKEVKANVNSITILEELVISISIMGHGC